MKELEEHIEDTLSHEEKIPTGRSPAVRLNLLHFEWWA